MSITNLPTAIADRHLALLQQNEAFRPLRLHALALTHCDKHGIWHPPTTRFLLRELARKGQREATSTELDTAIRQGIAQGLLAEGSTARRLALSGARTTESADVEHDDITGDNSTITDDQEN